MPHCMPLEIENEKIACWGKSGGASREMAEMEMREIIIDISTFIK